MSDDLPQPDTASEPSQPPPTESPPAPVAESAQIPVLDLSARLTELESFLSERDKEITELKNNLAKITSAAEASESAVKEKEAAISRTFTALRTAILESHPDIPEEMVTGQTVEELQASLGKAAALVAKIKSQVTAIPGPAGAPARSGPDVSAMSSREKIVHALKGK